MKHKKILSVSVIFALIVLTVFYLVNNIQEFRKLNFVSPHLLILLIVLFIFNYYLIGIVTKNLLGSLRINLGNKEAFQLSIITGFYNLITPFRGGMAARALYLKKKYKFSYVDLMATLAASYVLIFLVAGLTGIPSAWLIYTKSGIFNGIIFAIFSGVFIIMVGIILVAPKFRERNNFWLNNIIKVVNGWHLIRKNRQVIFVTLVLSIFQLLIGSLMLYLQFRVFGINVDYISTLFLTSISSIGLLVGITPGNFGIQEAITLFSALTIGIGATESLPAALLGRAVSLIVLFILGPIFSYTLLKRKNEKNN